MAQNSKYGGLTQDGKEQVQRWLGHAKNYVQQVLAPRCQSIMSEVCVGVNWSTGEAAVFPEVKGRGYPDRPGWMFGTTDILAILNTGELLIGDWKTGGSDGAKEQLLSLGCAFQKAMQIGNPRPLITSCLSVDDDGVWPVERPYTQEEVANHWDSMRFATEDIGKQTHGTPGIHCTQLYCPHLANCSAITSIVEDGATADGKAPDGGKLVPASRLARAVRLTDMPHSDEEAGHIMAMVTAAKRQCKYIDTMMREYVSNGGRCTTGQWEWLQTSTGFRWRKR